MIPSALKCRLAVVVVLALACCQAFHVALPPTSVRLSCGSQMTTALQMTKKNRRRKRKEETDDLPDFDLGEDSEEASSSKQPINPDEITDVMMGTQKPIGSVKDLISDRSLEKVFQFDEPDDPLPDLADLTKPKVGKKKARQESRRTAAAMDEEQDGGRIVDIVSDALSSLPFLKSDRESSELKLVENATWLGIFLLVAWEVYINSPFFERAAPLAPIVYDFFM